jgi:hypothetical protein
VRTSSIVTDFVRGTLVPVPRNQMGYCRLSTRTLYCLEVGPRGGWPRAAELGASVQLQAQRRVTSKWQVLGRMCSIRDIFSHESQT